MFFNTSLSWQKRRDIILEVCGNISDQEVVDGSPELKGLAELIGHQTVEQIKKETAFKAKRIKEELLKIPPRIDELQLAEIPEQVVFEAKSFLMVVLLSFRRKLMPYLKNWLRQRLMILKILSKAIWAPLNCN